MLKLSRAISLLIGLSLMAPTAAVAQTTVEKYKAFRIQNSSMEVIGKINTELSSGASKDAFGQMIKEERRRIGYLNSQDDLDKFLGAFNTALKSTKAQHRQQEFFWKAGAETVKIGVGGVLGVLNDFLPEQTLPGKYLKKVLDSATQKGFEVTVDKYIEDRVVNTNRAEMDQLVRDRVNLLYSNNVDVTDPSHDEQQFRNLFAAATGDIPALDRDDYALFNKELVKYAYEFIRKNRDEIQKVNLKSEQRYDEVRASFAVHISEAEKRITEEVRKEFRELGESVANLTKNQKEVFETLDSIKADIRNNEKRIRVLEAEMVTVKNDVSQLKRVQDEHTQLISQNALQISTLSGYVFDGLSTEQKLEALKRGDFNNIFRNEENKEALIKDLEKLKATETIIGIFDGLSTEQKLERLKRGDFNNIFRKQEEKDALVKNLEKLKAAETAETIVSVGQNVSAYANQSYETLVQTGVLKGRDAQRVGKFMKYLTSTIQVGTGVARLYAGDPMGGVSVLAGIGGFFGTSRSPQVSAEMKFLEQMYEAMNQRFDKIDQHLSVIESKLDALGADVINMHKSIMASFQVVSGELERINWKIDQLYQITSTLLFRHYDACHAIEKARIDNRVQFITYSDYGDFHTNDVGECLRGLNDLSISNNNVFFYFTAVRKEANKQFVDYEVVQIYEPTRDLFRTTYKARIGDAMAALTYPTETIRDTNTPLLALKGIGGQITVDPDEVLANYLNYEMINQFSGLLLTYISYFEISSDSPNFKPDSLDVYLLRTVRQRGFKNSLVQTRLQKLLNLTDIAIAQQSLVAGNLLLEPAYTIMFTGEQKSEDIKLATSILRNNKLFARNFASLLLYKNLGILETKKVNGETVSASRYPEFLKEYERVKQAPEEVATLNKFLYLNDVKFKHSAADGKIYLTFTRLGDEIKILVPEPTVVLTNQMHNTEALFSLLETRQMLMSKLIDLSFTKNTATLPVSIGATEDHFKYSFVAN